MDHAIVQRGFCKPSIFGIIANTIASIHILLACLSISRCISIDKHFPISIESYQNFAMQINSVLFAIVAFAVGNATAGKNDFPDWNAIPIDLYTVVPPFESFFFPWKCQLT